MQVSTQIVNLFGEDGFDCLSDVSGHRYRNNNN